MSAPDRALPQMVVPGGHISRRDFDRLASFIYDYSGIKMPGSKTTMLEGRLRRRMKATGHPTFDSYCDYLFKEDGLAQETVYLIDAVTTNKTDFFREPAHFKYMAEHVLPDLVATKPRRIRAWSAACSTGAEPYTMAMVLDDRVGARADLTYEILATDLSTDVLATAIAGIYPDDMILPVPPVFRNRYVMQSREPNKGIVRIHPALRSRVAFARMNLMDSSYSIGEPVHIIFCRNVLIYFDKPTQAAVLKRLCDCLAKDGHLFIGHSESITGLDLQVRQVANTVFRKL